LRGLLKIDNYKRITSTNKYVPEIDGMRFVAIFTVVLLHIHANYLRVFNDSIPEGYEKSLMFQLFHNSDWGVKFFFAISGYILCLPFARFYLKKANSSKVKLKSYFVRRLSRLEPPFLISILVIYLLNLYISSYSFQDSFDNFLATISYSHVFIYGDWSYINPVTWSLETEVQFYIIAPFLSSLFLIKIRKVRILIMLSMLVVSSQLVDVAVLKNLHLHKSILPNLHYFLIGYFVVEVQLNSEKFFKQTSWMFDIFAWLGIPLLYFVKLYGSILLFDLILFLFFVSIFKSVSFKKLLSLNWVSTIGGMCYTIYLLHYALIYVFMDNFIFIENINFYLGFIAVIVLSCVLILALCMPYFRFFERPFMRKDWYNKIGLFIKS